MELSAKRRLSSREGLFESLQEDTGSCLGEPLQAASGEVGIRSQRSRKGRRKQRQAAFGSITMRGAPDACNAGCYIT